jgi:hypothetical protein
MKLSISPGNSKIGRTPNISLPPHTTCELDAPCRKDCYANHHAYKLYRQTKTAWDRNLAVWENNPEDYETQLRDYLSGRFFKDGTRYFRWHVGGDIPDQSYARMVETVAEVFPETEFLIYTRRDWLDKPVGQQFPRNLHVMRSQWIGEEVHTTERRFIVLPKGEPVPADGLLCPGLCEECRACWWLRSYPIYIHKH